MIPKIIHCCWFGGPKTPLARRCLASWRVFAPDWEIREWDEAGLRTAGFDAPGFAFFESAIQAKKWAMASDWARMFALFREGGLYLDFDSELVASPDGLPEGEWVAGEQTAAGEVWMNPGAGIALEKGSVVARQMLDAYAADEFDPKREMMPWINRNLAKTGVRMLDPEVMSPIDMNGRCRQTGRTIAIHRFAMGWATKKQRVLKWLSWHGMRPVIDVLIRLRRRFSRQAAKRS